MFCIQLNKVKSKYKHTSHGFKLQFKLCSGTNVSTIYFLKKSPILIITVESSSWGYRRIKKQIKLTLKSNKSFKWFPKLCKILLKRKQKFQMVSQSLKTFLKAQTIYSIYGVTVANQLAAKANVASAIIKGYYWMWVVCLHIHPHAGDITNEKSE